MMKILIGLGAVVILMLLAFPAMAGNQPEFDAVGCDARNFFNDFIKSAVCETGILYIGGNQTIKTNEYSSFSFDPATNSGEYFSTTAGMLLPDHCFNNLCPGKEYQSALTDPYNSAIYRWQIVLQKAPESDIDLLIRNCITKDTTFNIWTDAEQTGRYRAPWGQLIFDPFSNPMITVLAFPGPFATSGFVGPFFMDARLMPSLRLVSLSEVPFTAKALWAESLVMMLPATGDSNTLGQAVYNLRQGDYLYIEIRVPGTNAVNLRYGPDNVTLEYIGTAGMEYIGDFCGPCEGCVRQEDPT